jgi:CheY-like chemotaxis protein
MAMSDWSSGTCPRHTECEFFKSVGSSPLMRIKYATMYPFCKGGRHESCMRWFMMDQGRPVPDDLLPDGGKDVAAVEAGRLSNVPKARVLVVDDMPLFRKSLVTMVMNACRHTCIVEEAASGEEALEMLSGDPNDWKLVVTDYNMGSMSGYDLIVGMRANPGLNGVPVVIFSSETDSGVLERTSALPRVRWLEKKPNQEPFDAMWRELVDEQKA